MTFLAQPFTILNIPTAFGASIAPTLVALAAAGVPSSASAVLLMWQLASGNNNNTGDALLQVRVSKYTPWLNLASVRVSSPTYGGAAAGSFMLTCTSTFEYQVTAPGFSSVLSFLIMGYE